MARFEQLSETDAPAHSGVVERTRSRFDAGVLRDFPNLGSVSERQAVAETLADRILPADGQGHGTQRSTMEFNDHSKLVEDPYAPERAAWDGIR